MDLLSPAGVKISVSDELGEQLIGQGYKRRGGVATAAPAPAAPADTDKPRRTRRRDSEKPSDG